MCLNIAHLCGQESCIVILLGKYICKDIRHFSSRKWGTKKFTPYILCIITRLSMWLIQRALFSPWLSLTKQNFMQTQYHQYIWLFWASLLVSYFSRCFTFIVSISVNILSAANPAFWKFFLWKTKFSLSAFWNVSPLVYCKLIITFTMCGLLQAVYKAIANLKYESAFH